MVTRRDLPSGVQVAQTTHAAIDFCLQNPEIANEWNALSNYLVCVSARDEPDLDKIIRKCKERDLRHYVFREPDIGNEITAVCIEPSDLTQKIISNLPLTLKTLENEIA